MEAARRGLMRWWHADHSSGPAAQLARQCSTKAANCLAFVLACRPVGYTADKLMDGSIHSSITDTTAPDFSSGVNDHSDTMVRPMPAITAARTPSVAVIFTRPCILIEISAVSLQNVQSSPPPSRV